jgi:hypothetical protein
VQDTYIPEERSGMLRERSIHDNRIYQITERVSKTGISLRKRLSVWCGKNLCGGRQRASGILAFLQESRITMPKEAGTGIF